MVLLPIVPLLTCFVAVACHPSDSNDPRTHSARIDEVPAGTQFFTHDTAGTSTATYESGALASVSAKSAFGAPIASGGATRAVYGFVGREHDEAVGLVDLRARPYRADVGMFVAPDRQPLQTPADLSNVPANFDSYSYSALDPVNLEDRDGDLAGETTVVIAALAEGIAGEALTTAGASGVAAVTAAGADSPWLLVGDAVGIGIAYVGYQTAKHHLRENLQAASRSMRRSMESLHRRFEGRRYIFVTYSAYNPRTGQWYFGRTSTRVRRGETDLEAANRAVDERWSRPDHQKLAASGFAPRVDRALAGDYDGTPGSLAAMYFRYATIRGREQDLLDAARASGAPVANKINAVNPRHPLAGFYKALSHTVFGPAAVPSP